MYARHEGCLSLPNALQRCASVQDHKLMKGFLSQPTLLANMHLICMSKGQKCIISLADKALTFRCLKGFQTAAIAVLCFEVTPKRLGGSKCTVRWQDINFDTAQKHGVKCSTMY